MHLVIVIILSGFAWFLCTCTKRSKEIIIPEDIVILNHPQNDTGITDIDAHVFILFSIDCGNCRRRMPEINRVVNQFKRNNSIVSLMLNGESLDTFLTEFPGLFRSQLTICYDRYNSFKFENSIENPASILLVIQKRREIKIFTLSQYLITHKI